MSTEPSPSVDIPPFWAYMQPTLDALRDKGGSATIQELVERAAERMDLSDEQLSVPHDPARGRQSEVAYRMAWARSYLKKAGLVDNTNRGVWSLTDEGRNTERIDAQAIAREYRPAAGESGATTHMVDVRFDALSRTPLISRRDLDEAPFEGFKWDTQMSGVRIPDDKAEALEREWQRRLTARARGESPAVVGEDVIDRWREAWEEASSDSAWLERHRLRDAKREEVLPGFPPCASVVTGASVSTG